MLLKSLETGRLLIRALEPGDLPGFHSVWGDPEVIWWGADADRATTKARLRRLIVLGGETAHGDASALVNLYDPATNAWSALTPLPAPRFSGVAAAIGGTIYFTTGSSETTTWKGVLS